MAQVAFQDMRLSSLFTDPKVADAFRRAERDLPPMPAIVPDEPVLTPGAAAELVEA
jgi:hypothetical protein